MRTIRLNKNRWVALGTLGVLTVGTALSGAQPAQAKSKTWKKVAIAGAAVTGLGLITHSGKMQTLGAVAAAGGYYKYRHDKKKEQQSSKEARRQEWYRNRYGSNWREHYRPGA